MNYLIIFQIIILLFAKFTSRELKLQYSYINLVTNGSGYIGINSGMRPDKVYINNFTQSTVNFPIYFSEDNNIINNVTLIWETEINRLNHFFSSCGLIIEIDLSNFDASKVTNMNSMFHGCTSLKYLNLKNLNTSQVKDMRSMFYNCVSLKSLDLSNLDTSQVTSMNALFYNCKSLEFLNLSNLDTSQVKDMGIMFSGCGMLKSLDLSNFDTSQVVSMSNMFGMCTSLISLNLSNLNASQVIWLDTMFNGCKSLISLDLSSFIIKNVISMSNMFAGCSALISLKLSNFIQSQVKNLNSMFFECSSLTDLDLSNFDTSHVTDMSRMFWKCSSLNYLDLSSFNTSQVISMNSIFFKCTALDNLNLSIFDISQVTDLNSVFRGCSSLKNLELFKYQPSKVKSLTSMFLDCSSLNNLDLSKLDTSQVISMNSMFNGCSSLNNLDISKLDTSQVTDMMAMFKECSSLTSIELHFNTSKLKHEGYMFYFCSKLEYIYFKDSETKNIIKLDMFNSLKNIIICSENDDWENVFTNEKYKITCINNSYENINYNKNLKCYSLNKTKLSCELCGNNFYRKYNDSKDTNISFNCYDSPDGYYLEDNLYKPCYFSCKKCIKFGNETEHNCIECNNFYASEIIISNYKNCYEYEISKNSLNILIQHKIDSLLNELNILDIDNGIDKTTTESNIIFILTSTFNQKNYQNDYNVTFDLGICENILKNEYNISINNSLYILLFIYEEKGMKIPKIEYEVYYPLFNNKDLIKLNLTICKDKKIDILLPVKINDIIDKYNPCSRYYNNICYKAASIFNTDISLKDRRNEFMNNNMTLCEEDCKFIEYNYATEKVKCSCNIKLSITPNYDVKFNKKEFFKNFININNFINFNVMKCHNTAFKSLFKNYGFFILISIIILYFITLSIFITISKNKLKKDIYDIYAALKSNEIQIKNDNSLIKVKIKRKIKIKRKKKLKKIMIIIIK